MGGTDHEGGAQRYVQLELDQWLMQSLMRFIDQGSQLACQAVAHPGPHHGSVLYLHSSWPKLCCKSDTLPHIIRVTFQVGALHSALLWNDTGK